VPEVSQTTEKQHEHADVQPSVAPSSKANCVDSPSKTSTDATKVPDVPAPLSKKLNQAAGTKEKGPPFSAPWRIDWATLLKRVYQADSLACLSAITLFKGRILKLFEGCVASNQGKRKPSV
jgi:hypothetical protein